MKKILIISLLLIAIGMIFIGVSSKILPPTLTGVGFFIIAALFYQNK
ncbi:hypothetical protein [Flavobacterium ardleyense]|nr:hypothetical protein [Flavobacterium ardleyense]